MDYIIVKNGIIENIIVCESREIAEKFGAVPMYESAMIGDPYDPPRKDSSEEADQVVTVKTLEPLLDSFAR